DADAGERLAQQLGLYGDDLPGLEPESLVWAAFAGPNQRARNRRDGIPALSPCADLAAGADRAQRAPDHLPDHELQQLAEGSFRFVGAAAAAGRHLARVGRFLFTLEL